MPSVAVFDFDGVIVDSNALKVRAFFTVFEDIPGAADVVDTVLAVGPHRTRDAVIADVLGRLPGVSRETCDQVVARYSGLVEEQIVSREFPGARRVLMTLQSAGVRLYLNSMTPIVPLRRILKRLALDDVFVDVFGAEMGKTPALAEILTRERVMPQAMVVIGDGSIDRWSAVQAADYES